MLKFHGKRLINNKGFTLIEIIVTLAVLSIVVVPITGYFVQAAKLNAASKDKLTANQIAQKYMERFKSKSGSIVAPVTFDSQDDMNTGYHVWVDITPQAGYTYPPGDDIIPNIDFNIIHNDSSSSTYANQLIIVKTGESNPFFNINTVNTNAILNVTIRNSDLNTRYEGFIEGNPTVLMDKSKPFTLKPNANSVETEYLRVEVNTNKNLTLNIKNELTKASNKECMIYIVRQKGKTGKVLINTLLGKINFVENLYDKSATAGLPIDGLYKIVVRVYKGTDRTGTKLCTLESLLN